MAKDNMSDNKQKTLMDYLDGIRSFGTGSLDTGRTWNDYVLHFYPRVTESEFSASVQFVNMWGGE
jgi:hypothetical protein